MASMPRAVDEKCWHLDRTGSAANPRSDVGNLTSGPTRGSASDAIGPRARHAAVSSTVGREVRRGEWRRPHVRRTRLERVGLVLWWLVVAAFLTGGAMYLYTLEQV